MSPGLAGSCPRVGPTPAPVAWAALTVPKLFLLKDHCKSVAISETKSFFLPVAMSQNWCSGAAGQLRLFIS